MQPSKPTRGVRNGALSHKKSFKARPRSHPTTPGHYHKPPPLTKYDHPMWATLIVAFPSFTTPTNLIFRMSLVGFKGLIHPHTCWCRPPVNDSYQQGALLELFCCGPLVNDSYQQGALLELFWCGPLVNDSYKHGALL